MNSGSGSRSKLRLTFGILFHTVLLGTNWAYESTQSSYHLTNLEGAGARIRDQTTAGSVTPPHRISNDLAGHQEDSELHAVQEPLERDRKSMAGESSSISDEAILADLDCPICLQSLKNGNGGAADHQPPDLTIVQDPVTAAREDSTISQNQNGIAEGDRNLVDSENMATPIHEPAVFEGNHNPVISEDGNALKVLPCNHIFHSSCINSWITHSINQDCPVCRTAIGLKPTLTPSEPRATLDLGSVAQRPLLSVRRRTILRERTAFHLRFVTERTNLRQRAAWEIYYLRLDAERERIELRRYAATQRADLHVWATREHVALGNSATARAASQAISEIERAESHAISERERAGLEAIHERERATLDEIVEWEHNALEASFGRERATLDEIVEWEHNALEASFGRERAARRRAARRRAARRRAAIRNAVGWR